MSTRVINNNNNEHRINDRPVNNQEHPYHLVKASPWPICVAFSLFKCIVYSVLWMHGYYADDCIEDTATSYF